MSYLPKTRQTVQTLLCSTVCNHNSFVTFAAASLKLDKYIRATKEEEMPSYLFEVPPHLSQNSPQIVFNSTKTPSARQLASCYFNKSNGVGLQATVYRHIYHQTQKGKSRWMSINSLASLYFNGHILVWSRFTRPQRNH